MTSAGHHSMMGGGKSTPQPVEYLESDGRQWFDVDISYGSNTGFYIDYMPMQIEGDSAFFGATRTNTNYTSDFKLIITAAKKQRFDRYDRSSAAFGPSNAQRQNFTFNPKGNQYSTPYRYYSSISGRIGQYDSWYSSSYQSIKNKIGIFHSAWNVDSVSDSFVPAIMRLYNFELREYSSATAYTTTLKLTPVQAGVVGAFLDEISGTLHFNQGAGAFILPS